MYNMSSQALDGVEFNVRAYGAKGNASNNDTVGIQAALDAAATWAASNGGEAVVRIPPGRYKCDSTLIVKTGTTVMAYGAYIYSGNLNYLCSLYISQAANYTTGFSNIKILGGIWDAKGDTAASGNNYNAFTLSSSRNITFRDVTIRNIPSYHAIDINSCENVTIDNCRFEGFKDNTGTASRAWSEAIQLQEYSTSGCQNITVTNCYLGPSRNSSGTVVLNGHGKLIGSHTNTGNTQHRRIIISKNTIDGSTDIGIGTQCWDQFTIEGNIFKSTALSCIRVYSISTGAITDISITGNVFSEYGDTAVNFDGNSTDVYRNCVISNNTFSTSSATAGIKALYLDNLEDSVVSGNAIKDGTDIGIFLQTCNDVLVTGNSIQDVDGAGIQVADGARNTLSGNKIYNVGKQGIWLTNNTVQNHIDGNTIIGVGKTTTNTYGCIEFGNSTVSETTISSNKFHKSASGNQPLNPIVFVSSSPTRTFIAANNDFSDDWSTNFWTNVTLAGATANSDYQATLLLHRTTTQSATNQTDTPIQWSSAIKNTGPSSWWSSGANTQIVMPWAGLYQVTCSVQWASNATGIRAVHLSEGVAIGSPTPQALFRGGNAVTSATTEAGRTVAFTQTVNVSTAGTVFLIAGWQNSGGSLSMDLAVSSTGIPIASASITYLGNNF